jgi:hypothetical protein
MKNASIIAQFEHNILSVRFLENARVELDDVKELYEYGDMWAHGNPYCILFEPTGHYHITEEAIEYFSSENPHDKNIIAKAYVVNDKESKLKTHMHLLFDQPRLKPNVFSNHADARKFLESAISMDKE